MIIQALVDFSAAVGTVLSSLKQEYLLANYLEEFELDFVVYVYRRIIFEKKFVPDFLESWLDAAVDSVDMLKKLGVRRTQKLIYC